MYLRSLCKQFMHIFENEVLPDEMLICLASLLIFICQGL